MIKFTFNSIARENHEEIAKAVKILYGNEFPVIICVGSDLVVGDSLGPIVGSKLLEILNGKAFVYGTLSSPITAKEIETIKQTTKKLHPHSKVIVVDAGVGNSEDIGQIKIADYGINPGLGVNKILPLIGDVSIVGIVGEKERGERNLNDIRLNLVNTLAYDIIRGLCLAFIKN